MASFSVRNYDRAEQVREIIKCGKDPVYFIQKYCKIQHMTRGLIPFETFEFQDDCVRAFVEHRMNIVLKSRQLGLSTITAAFATWLAIFQKDKNVLVIATKLPTAQNFIMKVHVILKNLPKWLLLPKYEPSKQQIGFSNGSQIKAIPTSPDAGRSEALSLLIVDEAAHIRDFDEIWTGLSPTISTGGRAIVLSTPKGIGGQYYKLWTEAVAGVNGFNPIKIFWDQHPEHDEAWFKSETRNMSQKQIAQEFLCDFTSSGDTFLQPADLEYLRENAQPPKEKLGHDRNVWVWVDPNPDHTYIISADVARGDAKDYSAFHVIDATASEVVAEYMGKIPPEKFADVLFEWGKKYNNSLIMPEKNTFGYFVNTKLRDLGYPKMFYENHRGDPFTYVPISRDELPGFTTSLKTRIQILTKLEEMLRTKQLTVRSERLINQLQGFVWVGNKPTANRDSHDDLIMSLAIGCWLLEGGAGVGNQATALAYAMLASTKIERVDHRDMPHGVNTIQPFMSPQMRGINPRSIHRPRGAGQVRSHDASDFSWLFK